MRVNECVQCTALSCADVDHDGYIVPAVALKPASISIVMVSEAAPADASEFFYAPGSPLFATTTVLAFQDAGAHVTSVRDIVNLGVYLTTAVKCSKTGCGIRAATIRECSLLLEKELQLFPNVRAVLLMGDVAIRAMNQIARRESGKAVIPAGSTYRIRHQPYFFHGVRVFPSYLQAGPSFFIEKSKRRMIAEDIAAALRLVA